ncbi:MAG TPA: hypothetical protein VGC42_04640 [Kofleriaceae bacterium]
MAIHDIELLEALRGEASHCHGLAWLAGAPLAVIASAGEPAELALADWDAVAKVAPVLLREGPVASPEVMIRGEAALMLLAERGEGVVAVIVAASGGSPGMALVQARMLASRVEAAVAIAGAVPLAVSEAAG